MSYVSPAERERQRWITLKEAISHIQRVDGCDEVIAFAQLRRALADGAIEARWGPDEFSPRLFEIQPGRRIRLATFWRTVPIDEEGGFIPGGYPEDLPDADPDIEDNSPEQYMPKRYYLFVLRDSISRHWASPDPENAVKSQSPPADVREAVFGRLRILDRCCDDCACFQLLRAVRSPSHPYPAATWARNRLRNFYDSGCGAIPCQLAGINTLAVRHTRETSERLCPRN
jgi:hypothetical protein